MVFFMKYNELATSLVSSVGGFENIDSVIHCATRLRFKLNDSKIPNKESIKAMSGVISVVEGGGQFQVIIGNAVGDVFKEIEALRTNESGRTISSSNKQESTTENTILSQVIQTIAGIFVPILGALTGAGVIKGLLEILAATGVMARTDGTFIIWNVVASSVFYFLPVLLAFSAAKTFSANQYVSATVACSLVLPDILKLIESGTSISFIHIPVTLINYTSSVIPIIISIYVLSKVEKFLNSKIHDSFKNILIPFVCLMTIAPLTFLVFGPIGSHISNGLASFFSYLYNLSPIIAGALIGCSWQLLVIFGVHWGFIPVIINNLSKYGQDSFIALLGPSNFAQAGAALGVFLKTKNKKRKEISGAAAISGLFGITEPTIYGVSLPLKKPFICASIAGAVGGAMAGYFNSHAISLAIVGIMTLPVFYGPGFSGFIAAVTIAYFLSAILTYIVGFDDSDS
jgi:PTS system beta-glucosides-specific IIC component